MAGDSLASRGLTYSAQFCYVAAGVPFARHPLAPLPPPAPPNAPPASPAPPRLSLLLAEPKPASLSQLATNRAILATEIYEYARSLSTDFVIHELQVNTGLLPHLQTFLFKCFNLLKFVFYVFLFYVALSLL